MAVLNRQCEGEDNRFTIKCQRERHHNLEVRNLERDFGSLALVTKASVP
jgi:adenylyl- and sulfurtransferase ThiI